MTAALVTVGFVALAVLSSIVGAYMGRQTRGLPMERIGGHTLVEVGSEADIDRALAAMNDPEREAS